jgi:hypothetical protein
MSNGGCVGYVETNHTRICSGSSSTSMMGFNDTEVSLGMLDPTKGAYRTLLQGAGWLVHNGSGHVDQAVANKEISQGFVGASG